jgi:hypothetical protein
MHLIAEESARLDVYSKRWEIADTQFNRLIGMKDKFKYGFSEELQTEIRRVYVQELARDILALAPDKITIIESPED